MARRLRITLLSLALLSLCLLLTVSFLITPGEVYAGVSAQDSCIGGGTVSLAGIDPTSISNKSATTITIIGQGFEDGAVVVLQGYSALQTTFVSDTLLKAEVPAGVPGSTRGRSYDVVVYNPNDPETNCAVLVDALTVYRPITAVTSEATETPTSTPEPTNFVRPAVTVQSYVASAQVLWPGQDIDFEVTVQNLGQVKATNVIATFVSGDLIPRATGGVQVIPDLSPGESYRFSQPLRVDSNLWDYEAILVMEVSYTDQYGAAYNETFDLSFPVNLPVSTPTPTPTLSVRPDVVIEAYETEPAVLRSGSTLQLHLDLANVSPLTARQVIIRLSLSQTSLEILAPLSSSNERYIDQLAPGEITSVTYDMAVNGDAEAGLVPVDFELSYIDNQNIQYTETETVSLRIDTTPRFYISLFSEIPEVITVGDTFELPIQVINIGTQSINVNTIEVTCEQMTITNGLLFLGELDSGTSGSLIAQAQALEPGTAIVKVHVNYLDAFQDARVYIHEIPLEVQGEAVQEGQPETGSAAEQGGWPQAGAAREMTFWQRLKQALLGFFGLAVRDQTPGGFRGATTGE